MTSFLNKLSIAGLAAGTVSVLAMGTVAVAGANAYQTYKEAEMAIVKEMNFTSRFSYTIQKEGETLLWGEMDVEMGDDQNCYIASTMSSAEGDVFFEEAIMDGVMVVKIGDQCVGMDLNESSYGDVMRMAGVSYGEQSSKTPELMFDAVLGDSKNLFTFSGDSGDTITLTLEDGQIPETYHAAAAFVLNFRGADTAGYPEEIRLLMNMLGAIDLERDIQVKRIDLKVEVAEDLVGRESYTMVLAGKDSSGEYAEYPIHLEGSYSLVGKTTPRQLDVSQAYMVPMGSVLSL